MRAKGLRDEIVKGSDELLCVVSGTNPSGARADHSSSSVCSCPIFGGATSVALNLRQQILPIAIKPSLI